MMRDNFNDTIENRNKKTCESHNENEIDGTSTLLENVFERERNWNERAEQHKIEMIILIVAENYEIS